MTDRPLLEEIRLFLSDPGTWWGTGSIPLRLAEHLLLSAAAVIITVVLVIPPALWAAHRRRGVLAASAVVNIGRAVPTFGILGDSGGVAGVGSMARPVRSDRLERAPDVHQHGGRGVGGR